MNPRNLLVVAERLTQAQTKGKVSQESLRRAISTAYYALFHLLTQSASHEIGGPSSDIEEAMTRWFDHRTMYETCGLFRSQNLPTELFPRTIGLPSTSAGAALQSVAQAFRELQEARHTADYDTRFRGYTTSQARIFVEQARQAFDDWEQAKGDPWWRIFLLTLLVGKKFAKDQR